LTKTFLNGEKQSSAYALNIDMLVCLKVGKEHELESKEPVRHRHMSCTEVAAGAAAK
jgi:hypothetical protein